MYYKKKYINNFPKPKQTQDEDEIVTIQLPVYNEIYVVERLINAVCQMDYPKDKLEIQVLDDSIDETKELIAKIVAEKQVEGFNIRHLQRAKREGFKAGALKEGLKTAKGKYIAIFDADFVPDKQFLRKTLKYFSKNDIGMVQTRWVYFNENYSLLTKVQSLALSKHFVLEQTVCNRAGFFINFNGTAGVWRKECIEDAGNWNSVTLTEDFDLSYRAQLKGWQFIYLDDVTTPSELPIEIDALKSQQFRWTKGAIETMKIILPRVWASKISFRVKLQSTFHLCYNILHPFTFLIGIMNLPFVFIKNSGQYWNLVSFITFFFVAFSVIPVCYFFIQNGFHSGWRKKILPFSLLILGTMGFSLNNTLAVIEGLIDKKSEFVRTPKGNVVSKKTNLNKKNKYSVKTNLQPLSFIELVLSVYCFIGILFSVYFKEIVLIPLQLLFFIGFMTVSFVSLNPAYGKK
jgi:cellulose synthase/poly-beta-1,6-N-acetylglucosamine synthase-like glycosyltransferase